MLLAKCHTQGSFCRCPWAIQHERLCLFFQKKVSLALCGFRKMSIMAATREHPQFKSSIPGAQSLCCDQGAKGLTFWNGLDFFSGTCFLVSNVEKAASSFSYYHELNNSHLGSRIPRTQSESLFRNAKWIQRSAFRVRPKRKLMERITLKNVVQKQNRLKNSESLGRIYILSLVMRRGLKDKTAKVMKSSPQLRLCCNESLLWLEPNFFLQLLLYTPYVVVDGWNRSFGWLFAIGVQTLPSSYAKTFFFLGLETKSGPQTSWLHFAWKHVIKAFAN